ncbi:NAD-dependent epimerase/dehydratase family protein [Methanoplanus endosymbiosus]|uniref:NAD(P)-dependent oxidoreductase n=1 Tax=Methanoplanus endosymbiosus TaxID=33865 RepID=A0A9E7PKB8_9EURY|nr:NAD(P)-dependent oxidoreductase [Methanoplanus endosymbiosus]UUX91658.1 NAD(P)-dependent oxidoreductase [Methanoplanus endosymbiosus]
MNSLDSLYLNKKVLVTGASGFIGRHLLARLYNSGANVNTISRKRCDFQLEIGQFILDICDEKAVRDCVLECQPDYIFHLAAYKERSTTVESLYTSIETNLIGSLNLFSAAKDMGLVKSIITLGTAEEYGINSLPFCENMRESPATSYSFSKLCVSNLSELFWRLYDFPVTIIRPTLAYGPGQGIDMFLPALIISLRDNKKFNMTFGNQTRDFVYVEDLVEALLVSSQTSFSKGQIINIGSGKTVKLSEIAYMVEKIMGKIGLVCLGGHPYRNNEVMDYYVDINKAKDLLNWNVKTPLDVGLQKTIAYYCGEKED